MSAPTKRTASRGLRSQWRRAWSTRQPGATLLSPQLQRQLRQEYGDLSDLRRVGSRPPLREYLTELWDRRHFIWAGARGEALTRYSNERLGAAWYVIRPLLDAAFYWVIFGLVLGAGGDLPNYVAFVLIGVFMFQPSARAITGGASLIRGSKAMIRAFAFPRAGLAVSLVVRDLLSSLPAIVVMLLMLMAIPPRELPSAAWSLFPVILVIQLVLNLGLTLLFGWLGARWPDLAQGISFATRLLMYGSAVIFPIERFITDPTLLAIVEANPLFQILDAYRTTLIDGAVPDPTSWLVMLGWACGTLLVGFLLFWIDEERYGRE